MDTNTSKFGQKESTTAKKNHNSSIFSTAPIPNTPFTMVHDTEKGYIITLGNGQLCDWKKTEKEALKTLPNGDIKTLIAIIVAISTNVNELKKLEETK